MNTINSSKSFSNIVSGAVCWLDNNSVNSRFDTGIEDDDYMNILTYEDTHLSLSYEGREISLPSNLDQAANLIDDEKELYIF